MCKVAIYRTICVCVCVCVCVLSYSDSTWNILHLSMPLSLNSDILNKGPAFDSVTLQQNEGFIKQQLKQT
jgi:hypothetical protein